jgi:hypothetical protein
MFQFTIGTCSELKKCYANLIDGDLGNGGDLGSWKACRWLLMHTGRFLYQ